MLVIRMQRTGRKGHAQFRVVVQDSRRTPTSGKIVAALGHFNPHTKETVINKEKASFFLEHGAQPSERVIRLLKSEGVKMPKWVAVPDKKKGDVRNPEKRRSTRPAEATAPVEAAPEAPIAETEAETSTEDVADTEAETTVADAEAPATESEAPAEEVVADAPAEPAAEKVAEEPAPEAETEKA